MPTTYTLVSWTAIFGLAGLIFYFNYYKPSQLRQAAQLRGLAKGTEKKKEPKKFKKARKDDASSGSIQEMPQKEQQKAKAEYTLITSSSDGNEEQLNNREFARQLSNAKAGTLMPSKSQEGAKQRSVKQTRAQEKLVETSSDNGTTGADADDDRSSLNSPELGATTLASTDANGDVSDMLEARPSGPSVLRVTSSPTSPAVVKKAKVTAPTEIAETKKQRQNRQKIELKRHIREVEEEERKVLLEKQRRTAREAEGRAAKDGSTFMATKAPTLSPWTAPTTTTNGNGNKATDAAKADLLDTYTPKAPTSHETTPSGSELAGSDWQKLAESISEEEQVRRAIEDTDSWKTVSKDKRKKKAQATKSELNDEDESSDFARPRLVAPSKPGQVWGMTLVEKHGDGHYEEYKTDVQDSEWEVA